MKLPPRFAITRASLEGSLARLIGDELHHLRDVVRLRKDAEVSLIDETGTEYLGTVERLASDYALITVRKAAGDPPLRAKIVMAAGLIKGPRMDFIVEKAAELGATELRPLLCERSVAAHVGAERLMRWRRLATAAAKQSLAPPMVIREPAGIDDLIRSKSEHTTALFCSPEGDALAKLVRDSRPAEILVACGPEGDFTPQELTLMRRAGFHSASLGPHRLRSETAALTALSLITGALDEIREQSTPRT
jgi:16S rRNA (uracil1498-N3)-methyltransferase